MNRYIPGPHGYICQRVAELPPEAPPAAAPQRQLNRTDVLLPALLLSVLLAEGSGAEAREAAAVLAAYLTMPPGL